MNRMKKKMKDHLKLPVYVVTLKGVTGNVW